MKIIISFCNPVQLVVGLIKDEMPVQGLVAALIRFTSVIPFFYLGTDGLSLYNIARQLEVLSTISQGQKFLQGLKIAAVVVYTVLSILLECIL